MSVFALWPIVFQKSVFVLFEYSIFSKNTKYVVVFVLTSTSKYAYVWCHRTYAKIRSYLVIAWKQKFINCLNKITCPVTYLSLLIVGELTWITTESDGEPSKHVSLHKVKILAMPVLIVFFQRNTWQEAWISNPSDDVTPRPSDVIDGSDRWKFVALRSPCKQPDKQSFVLFQSQCFLQLESE